MTALRGAPETAFAMAWRMAQDVKTEVDRPMHVAMVKGLNRKLKARRATETVRMEPPQSDRDAPGVEGDAPSERSNLHGSDGQTTPTLFPPGRGEPLGGTGLARFGDVCQGIGAQEIDENIEQCGEDGIGSDVREEGEERKEERRLVIDTTVVR